ncbi:leucine-rich repeat and fibronectin type III domain-containing protein 1-like protein [Nilaparvata lugens]|uniref:leucine-rich repeat and fibronectin type III domain-containing protein 1-like protein n=1 Tax=Nilaparvata lugens TaxID=108931 RepID=UPI00193D1584|nr:leucine-rich repeat and fibronectin type III domain-containing protein 1-like protein [Nilaparvata lugens]
MRSAEAVVWRWLALAAVLGGVGAQCPWGREIAELQSSCICAYNLGQMLSVQCDMVDFPELLKALDEYASTLHIDLLYVNNSSVQALHDAMFANLKLNNLQMSGCKIRTVGKRAFQGLEPTLRNLNLQDNELDHIPIESIQTLTNLSLLDLSRNKITKVPDGAFASLNNLSTLKLSDNNITISTDAFRGLEGSLKNLNLKGTRQKVIPEAVRNLRTLAFLDLAQNGLRELPGPAGRGIFDGLHSLTALNLERNVIQTVTDDTFHGIRNTLSSLSLLNNLLTDFPVVAVSELSELRVLDIGFNLLTELPIDAFQGTPSLTLLALDGNPLASIPAAALAHLNSTLRGLSLGGRFLHCDCRLRWVAEWIRHGDLQVTSRERNPQFCGSPPSLKDKSFYNMLPEELVCENENMGVALVVNDQDDLLQTQEIGVAVGYVDPHVATSQKTSPSTTSSTTELTTTTSTTTTTTTTTTTPRTTVTTQSSTSPQRTMMTYRTTPSTTTTSTTTTTTPAPPTSRFVPTTRRSNIILPRTTSNPWPQQRPHMAMAFPSAARPVQEVLVRSAHRLDNSVIIQWDSETANILGFRVVYRLFGDKSFKQGPPLEASEREFKIKNVPSQECIVVCVISLEEMNVTPESVPYSQCREVRTVTSPTSNMDKITIAASAAICGTVVIAVIVFVAASRRRSRKLHTLGGHHKGGHLGGLGAPVACCPASSPGPLSSLATLSAFTTHKDWDQVSVYSNRSLGRPQPRMYHMERQGSLRAAGCMGDEPRTHIPHFTSKAPVKARSIADGQSQHSFSNNSGRYMANNAFSSGLVNSRPELRQSRQSLAVSERLSRISYPTATAGHQRPRQRPRSRNHDTGGGSTLGGGGRPASRYSTHGSTHTLNNYCGDTSDNWTDHDMDIYMTRNPTTRSGLVPL